MRNLFEMEILGKSFSETGMKKHIGFLVVLLVLFIPALAEGRGGDRKHGVGGGGTFLLMVLLLLAAHSAPPQKSAITPTSLDTQTPLTSMLTASGSGMNPGVMILTTITIILGSMGISRAGSAPAMSSAWKEGAGRVFGLVASTLASPHTTMAFAMTGSGILTRS
jgi:hypothetical protein